MVEVAEWLLKTAYMQVHLLSKNYEDEKVNVGTFFGLLIFVPS